MIIRVKHKTQYLVITRDAVRDQRLSFETRGLLAYMLSFDSDWQFFESEICKRNHIGEKNFRRMLKQLIENGYCMRKKVRDEKGRFIYEYVISEKADLKSDPDKSVQVPFSTGGYPPVDTPPVDNDCLRSSNKESNINRRSSNERSSDSGDATTTISSRTPGKTPRKIYLNDRQKEFVYKFVSVMNKNGIPYSPEFKDLQAVKSINEKLLDTMEQYMIGWPRFMKYTDDSWIHESDGSIVVFKRSFSKFKNYFDEMYTFEEFEEVQEPNQ